MTSANEILETLGWRPYFADQMTDDEVAACLPVRVMTVHRGKISVAGTSGQQLISPYIVGAGPSDAHPTVGDWLLIDRSTHEAVRILDRLNLFKRRAPGDPNREQMIAANVDTLFVVASCNQDFSVARLERYLVLAREVGVKPVVVLTKTDLTEDPGQFVAAASAIEPGLRVEPVNGRDPASVARLAAWCGKGETVALLGSSGVGKSTLVNTLRGSSDIATQAIRSRDDTGRHTTTVREMHRLDHGGWLLDTPGMRELQLPQAATGIAEIFDDFILVAEQCRFSNCAHGSEPDCAVRAAIADGTLTADRFERWQKLAAEDRAAANPPKRRR
ncbi:MAG TPA: ribosome small subunit-dependent GTPase A [Sphingopyxis sp.]|jgi:ribosome biogenesis GTPase|uniref:ribosome small subunit-dependent GTPase A n=1 Tax=Sphingopyxis sp. TaxID=1908224 RepID=UPI002E15CAB0|nr:ribosome small subunit-dependent GTPase A [Sphingopyxis sp.]